MSKLKELIEKLCPDGVVFKTLGELHSDKRSIMRGIRITKKDLIENGQYKVYGGGEDIIFGFYNKYNIKKDTVTINVAGSVGFVDYITEDSWIVDSRYAFFTNQMNLKFLYYALKNKENELRSFVKGAIPGINMDLLMKVSVPIPPMEVQREIVRILDNFTELTAELEARTKQYDYYLEKIFQELSGKYGFTKIKEISLDIYRGSGIKRDEVTSEGTPCVRYGEIYTSYNISFDTTRSFTNIKTTKYFDNNDILFAITGEKVEEIGKAIVYTGTGECAAGSDIVVLKHSQNGKYISYMLSTYSLQRQKSFGKVKSKVVHMSATDILGLEMPIPPLEEQERIVSILDKFFALVTDIKEGLPAEIELRHRQYEYYRNKLLTFDKE